MSDNRRTAQRSHVSDVLGRPQTGPGATEMSGEPIGPDVPMR